MKYSSKISSLYSFQAFLRLIKKYDARQTPTVVAIVEEIASALIRLIKNKQRIATRLLPFSRFQVPINCAA
jgi:hypothetical protein